MDSNCVNNYLGHALRAKCWHSLHIHACQKRQTRRTWKSLCAQLIQRLHKDLLHRSQGWKKRFKRSWLAQKCAYVAATRLSGIILHVAGQNLRARETPQGRPGRLKVWLQPPLLPAWWWTGKRNQHGSYLITVEIIVVLFGLVWGRFLFICLFFWWRDEERGYDEDGLINRAQEF